MTGNFIVVPQLDDAIRAFRSYPNRFLWRKNFHTKPLCLDNGAPREIATTQAVREAEIVFNPRTHARLSAGSIAFDDYGMQTFGRAVHCSSQSGRTSANDRQVIKVGLRASTQAYFLRDIGGNTLQKLCSVREQHNGKACGFGTQRLQQTLGFWIIRGNLYVDPLIGDAIACQKIAQLIRTRRPSRTQHTNSLKCGTVRSLPVVEQVIQLGIKVLFRRVPGLQEKVIDVDLIDRADGGASIGISGKEGALCVWEYVSCFLKKGDAIHFGHALVGQQQSHAVTAD